MRLLCKRYGVQLSYTPMINTYLSTLYSNQLFLLALLIPFSDTELITSKMQLTEKRYSPQLLKIVRS